MTMRQGILGDVITWNSPSNELHVSTIRNAMATCGLNDEVVRDMRLADGFRRACSTMKENRIIRKLKNKGGTLTFQFTKEVLDDVKFEYAYEASVTVDKETGAVSCPESSELEKLARERLNHAVEHRSPSDITRYIQRLCQKESGLYPINPKKGVVYFVPEEHHDFTVRLQKFINSIGGTMGMLPVPKGDTNGDRSVAEAISAGLDMQLKELEDRIDSYDETTKSHVMKRTDEKLQEALLKADALGHYLLYKHQEVTSKVNAARNRLLDKMFNSDTTDGDDDKETESPAADDAFPVGPVADTSQVVDVTSGTADDDEFAHEDEELDYVPPRA